jgi:hypothetical protein
MPIENFTCSRSASQDYSCDIPFAPPDAQEVLLYRPIFKYGSPLDEALAVRWIGVHFFFSFEFPYLGVPKKPRGGGLPRGCDQLSQKSLAVHSFIVQNGPAWS